MVGSDDGIAVGAVEGCFVGDFDGPSAGAPVGVKASSSSSKSKISISFDILNSC